MANAEDKELDEGINLEHYGLLFLSHWHWFAISILLCIGVATFYLLRTTPVYTRTTQLLIKEDDHSGASSIMQDFKSLGLGNSNTNINNEILTISAPIMMEHVVKRLNLDMEMTTKKNFKTLSLYNNEPVAVEFANKAERDSVITFELSFINTNEVEISEFTAANVEYDDVVKVKLDGDFVNTPVGKLKVVKTDSWNDKVVDFKLTVRKYPIQVISRYYSSLLGVGLIDKEATVLNLSIQDDCVRRADDILLTLVDVYKENWIKDKNRMAESTYEFITARLETITKELNIVDKDISDFKSANLLPDMKASLTKDFEQSGKNYEALLHLNNQLSMTIFIRDYLSDKSKQDQLLPSNMGLPSVGLETMIGQYNTMMLERNSLLANTTEQSAVVKNLDAQLTAQRKAIHRSLDNLVAQLKKQIANVESSEKSINDKIATAPRQVRDLQTVERQQKVKEALYIFLLQKREENELSRTYTAWNTNIIQPPTGSPKPTSPRKLLVAALALMVGTVIPAAILFIRESMNTKVRGRKDLENTSLPLIGEIPNMATKKHWWQKEKKVARKIVVEKNNRDIINESFRIVRTKLEYYIKSQPNNKVVMFTSFNPGSGKSFITGNLTKTFALNGKKILAIDLDIRHCSLSGMLPRSVHQGISSYLSGGTDDIESLIVKNGFCEGVDVLPVGVIPPNPTELLYSDKLGKLIESMRDKYDYIFLDCPPIEIVADASIIKDYADVTIFVVRAGLMDRRVLGDVDELYKENKYNRLAILLNGTDFVGGKYGQYRYGYGYGYASGYAANYYAGSKYKN